MIKEREQTDYQKLMKSLDKRMAKCSEKQLEIQNEIVILAEIKELVHRIWLEDHPDNRG